MTAAPPKSTFDVTPSNRELWKDSAVWQAVQKKMFTLCRLYGLSEIKTPIFESVDLFKRSVGDVSDIVTKEMYEFTDKADRKLALRPEGTASSVRAMIFDRTLEKLPLTRVFYFGPMFRYERGQKGRYRQHYQFGVELAGCEDPFLDAEGIEILWKFYQMLGLENIQLHLNSIGDLESRNHYRNKLVEYLTPFKKELSEDSKIRLEKNPLRILDSKDATDQTILAEAPKIQDCLNSTSAKRFDQVKKALDTAQIPYILDPTLVRGLDYYNQTVFEIKSSLLGAQDTLGAGGRYDGLFKMLGGGDTPAFGFATGFERIIHTLLAQNPQFHSDEDAITLFLCPIEEEAISYCQKLANQLREHNISCVIDPRRKKMANAIQLAVKMQAKFFLAIGEEEMNTHIGRVKTLATKTEKEMNLKEIGPNIHENFL